MADFKVVIGTKSGQCVQKEVKEPESNSLMGKKIGDKIPGDSIGLAGYEFQISGGSDNAGFPMRKDVEGTGRRRIFAVQGVGLHKKGKGVKQRKTVCGNTIHAAISQINLKVLKEGKEKLGAAKAEEKPKEEKKEEPKKEEKPKAAEKPKEEKKEKTSADKPKEEKKEEKPAETQKPKVSEKPKEAPKAEK